MIGIFIGSFNPPTIAHLEICNKIKNNFKKIVFVPVNSKDKHLVSIRDRINMLEILVRKNNFLEVSKIMQDYSYLNYRIIDLLKEKYGNIVLIIGSDLLDKLSSFDNYEYLLENYHFYVISREEDINEIIKNKYIDYKNKFTIVEYHSDISSTMARKYLNNNYDTINILDKDVFDYIKDNILY